LIKLRIHIDTFVIGGCFDEEFEISSNKLFDLLKIGDFKGVISDITFNELLKAPIHVQEKLKSIPLKI
jgi:hypothetical protein